MLARRLPSLGQLLEDLQREFEAQWERVLLWTPVAFGVGAAAYMGLPREPLVLTAWIIALAGLAVALAARRFTRARAVLAASGLAAVVCLGFLAAKLHSDAVAAPIAPTGVTSVEGFVVDVEAPSERGPRLLIAPVDIEGLSPERTPVRVRIVVPQAGGPEATPVPGSTIRILTLLDPPPGPAAPGAYDFARDAWFEGVGGVGLALRPPEPVSLAPPPLALRFEMAVNALRWTMAARLAGDIRQVMGPSDGGAAGLAAAVTTSHQDWLPAADRDALRGSGLAHMLAIAGLHTAAVSGFAFFALRLLVAAWPWLSLRVSGKKIAAAGGLIVVATYLFLSGAHPPARRAAITAGAAFVAILADRQAVSLHSLALAALVVLLIEPEAVLQPGFEMSFCATASLVAMAEVWPRRATSSGLPWALAALQKGRDWLVALCMVSFVAGAATGPFAIQHFNRVANYGVFANLTADFLASAVLMPLLALCLIAEAFDAGVGQVAPLFWLAGWAARGVIAIGHVFSEAPGAGIAMSSAPTIALVISYVGIVFACLWRGRLRWVGLPMAMAVALWPRPASPVAWIAGDGGDAAIVAAGEAVALKPLTRLYATQTWAQHRGLRLPAEPAAALEALYDCDRSECKPKPFVRPAISAWWTKRKPRPEQVANLCQGAEFLILRADVELPADCRGVHILTRETFEKLGAAEVFAAAGGWRLEWSQPLRGERPWSVSDSAG
ncbi:MAG: ComEC/Rec2 family competence protein [Caulobacteraceae bacterium]